MGKNGNIHPTRLFKTPEELYKVWLDYKADLKIKAQEWPKVQYVGRDGQRVEDYPVMPLTYEGLRRYCYDNGIGAVHQYFDNKGGYYEDFVEICSRIKNEIREQQIIGGLNGFYNSSITQRLNGLVDKKEVEYKEQPLFGPEDNAK